MVCALGLQGSRHSTGRVVRGLADKILLSRNSFHLLLRVQVVTGGLYKVQILYTSKAQAQFKLSVGTYKDIQDGKAPALQARLPASVSRNTHRI